MLRNMCNSLLQHEAIKTTRAESQGTAPRRRAADHARQGADAGQPPPGVRPHCATATIVTKLFDELGPRYKARPGGYTRILKMGFRVGDNAPMAFVELVDRPEPVGRPTPKAEE